MRTIDIVAAVLLVIGGLNWGLVGIANFNLVAALFGTSIIASIVYALVGMAALYQIFSVKAIQRRWATA